MLFRKEYLVHQPGDPRIAFPKLSGNMPLLSNVIGCGYLTAICYQNIQLILIYLFIHLFLIYLSLTTLGS